MDAIDWSTAQRVGELLAGSPPPGALGGDSVQPLAQRFAALVSDYSGLALPAALPPLEAVDRPAWIAANLEGMRPILEPLAQQSAAAGSRARRRRPRKAGAQDLTPLYDGLAAAGALLLGAQVGAMAGMLSQRVLGQYDLALLDPTVTPRLLLVAPNLAQAARNMQVDRRAARLLGRDPRAHPRDPVLRRPLAARAPRRSAAGADRGAAGLLLVRRAAAPPDLRSLAERLRRGEILRITLGERRWQLVARLQATMSLIEGHAEHVMDAVGADVLPALPRLRAAMNNRRREHRGLPWKVLERLLGLERSCASTRRGGASATPSSPPRRAGERAAPGAPPPYPRGASRARRWLAAPPDAGKLVVPV